MSELTKDMDLTPVAADVLSAVEQFLYREVRLLNNGEQRQWLDKMVHEDISYRVYSRELRSSKDTQYSMPQKVYIYDEKYPELDARVKQFDSGMQWRVDPPERVRHLVTNVEAYQGEAEGELVVFSNCLVVRNRRVYEESQYVYGRSDRLRMDENGGLKLVSREVDYDQRYVEGRNLLFFL